MTDKPLVPKGINAAMLARVVVLRGAGCKQAIIARRIRRSQQLVSRYCKAAEEAGKGRELELVKWAVEVDAAMQKVAT